MAKFEIYKGAGTGEDVWRWRLKGSNNAKIARSEQDFGKDYVEKSIEKIQSNVNSKTPIYDDGDSNKDSSKYRFEYWESQNDKQWYWRLRASNGEKMAVGGEGFSSKQSVKRSIENVRLEMPQATVEWV